MIANLQSGNATWRFDLDQPMRISIPARSGPEQVSCFYASPMHFEPVTSGAFTGWVESGGSVNFVDVHVNPHGNGTHTECVGHIAPEFYAVTESLRQFLCVAQLISVYPTLRENGDKVIMADQLPASFEEHVTALIVRTLPNGASKWHRDYSGTNPPYFEAEGLSRLAQQGVDHLLTDLPSVDRESDGGRLSAHKAFWNYPLAPRFQASITELIYVDNSIHDGLFLLQHQLGGMRLDAVPSYPVLYRLI